MENILNVSPEERKLFKQKQMAALPAEKTDYFAGSLTSRAERKDSWNSPFSGPNQPDPFDFEYTQGSNSKVFLKPGFSGKGQRVLGNPVKDAGRNALSSRQFGGFGSSGVHGRTSEGFGREGREGREEKSGFRRSGLETPIQEYFQGRGSTNLRGDTGNQETWLSANLVEGLKDVQVVGRGLNDDTFGSTTLARDLRISPRDRRIPGGTMSTNRQGLEDRPKETDDTRDQSRHLKSSMKYNKPPCLQNTSALGISMTGRPYMSGVGFQGQGVVGSQGLVDHDDLKLKLDKLSAIFLERNREKDAFKDTFFDEESYGEEMRTRNYFKVSLDLLKYALHSANQPKKKKDDKKAGGLGVRR